MTARNGETSRRRGKARDDKEVLSEAHAPPAAARRGQVYATGETREGRNVFRTTLFYGMVFVTIAEQYVETHAPVPCDACKEAVYKHSGAGRNHKNPFAILAQLEKGLLQVDDGVRDSDRLPRVDTVLVELDDGTVLWPKAAEPAARKPSGASDLSSEAFTTELRSRFAGREFTSRDVLTEVEGAGKSTVYDRLRRLKEDGTIEMVGGTVGSRSDPPRFRFAGSPSVPTPEPEPVVAPAAASRIKSKDEINAEIASLGAQIEEAERVARERRAESIRAAETRVAELEAELETARARLREAEASRPEPEGIDALVERQRSLRVIADNYDLLIKSD